MRLFDRRLLAALLLLTGLCMQAVAQSLPAPDRPVSFNLSTSRSFAPGEQPTFHLYTHNVDALEFRVYRVGDPVKFLENLRELHSFGPEASLLAPEQIDERSWLERFHDWKHRLWEEIREFFRQQFSPSTRHAIRDRQSSIVRHSRIISQAEFAQVPLLNRSQLVSRWRLQVPPTFITDNNKLVAPKLDAGLYLIEATDGRYKAYTMLMVTRMALVTRTTGGQVMAFVVDRATGQPMAGVKVDAGVGQKLLASADTDAGGVAELALPEDKSSPDNFWVVAGKGEEFAASTPGSWSLALSGGARYAGYVFTERPVYRPLHTIHWKAYLRERRGNMLALPQGGEVRVYISDGSDKAVFDRVMPLPANGELNGDFDLPKDAALGYYTLNIAPPGFSGEGSVYSSIACGFHVEEYRKPEYRVQVKPAAKRILEGETMSVTIDSRYFFGEPVANGKVKYRIYHERHYWWGEDQDGDSDSFGQNSSGDDEAASYGGEEEAEKSGKLDANGLLTIQVPTHPESVGRLHPDLDYTVEAGVTDAANREITGRARFLATYAAYRVHVEPVEYAVEAGGKARFRVTTVDYDDKPVTALAHVQLVFERRKEGVAEAVPGPAVDVITDASGQAMAELAVGTPPSSSAMLEATAAATQPGTRDPVDASYLWILGSNEPTWETGAATAQIVADKKSYVPGETAHLSIVSPAGDRGGFYALVLVEGDTLLKRETLHATGGALAFDLKITAEAMPNLTVNALFLKDNTLYQAEKVVQVPPVQQRLQVEITPAKQVFEPQQSAVYDVVTRDAAGKPVSADLAVGVVDEAIYSLYPDISGDMVRVLYPRRSVEATVDSSLEYYFSGEAGETSPLLTQRQARFRPQLAQVKPGNEAKPRVRKAFPDTAFWAPEVHTDASGHARVTVTFPDSLTTWRATVHAITAASQAGSAIDRVLVRKDLIVRMGTPRFMAQGDEITLPVIVHNYLETPATTEVSLKAEGLDTDSGSRDKVVVPSHGEATVLWRLRASHIGTAKLTATAIAGVESDALELSFPVNPAGVAEDISQSGVVAANDPVGSARIVFPGNTDPAAHSLRVEVSPSIAGSLVPALQYLASYPYGCTEQTMSSYLPAVSVAETLNRLGIGDPAEQADLRAKMQASLERLKDYQHEDGGWGWWKEDESRVSMTAYVVAGLAQGSRFLKLTNNQSYMLNIGKNYLTKALEDHPRMRPELRAAVVYALAQQGTGGYGASDLTPELDRLWSRRATLPAEALAMTGLAMLEVHDARASEIAALLARQAVVSGELVSWKGSYQPLLDYDETSDTEATAFAVRLLARVNPNHPLLPGAAQWLMLARDSGGWWDSTEETALAVFGLADYLAASRELDSDYTIRVLVNGSAVAERHFTPADVVGGTNLAVDLDATQLQGGANLVQVVRTGGAGRVYWTAHGRYFSTDKKDFQAGTLSLNLTRDYFQLQPASKDGKVVYSLVPIPRSGKVEVGDVLAVHEAITGSPARYLLLEEPIPAGVEFVQNESSYPIDKRPGGWSDWFTRSEFRDDHAAFFASEFTGRQEIFYLVRVVNPGSFAISPARVTPMYAHGVQATTDSFRLEVPQPAPPAGGPQ